MSIIVTSPSFFFDNGNPLVPVIQALAQLSQKNPVYVVSNHAEPDWFDKCFAGSNVSFMRGYGRQSGNIIDLITTTHHGATSHDVMVLASNKVDLQMGKNGKALLIAAGWAQHPAITDLGIKVSSAQELVDMIDIATAWTGKWWFSGSGGSYDIKALSDLSGFYQSAAQTQFAKDLTDTVKNGGAKLNALLAITSRSLLKDGVENVGDLVWGVYPSSSSNNLDDEILSDFTHRVRTSVSRVRYAKRGEPLFIRHTHSVKRSQSPSSNRFDPSNQVMTLHLNPFYKTKGRLKGKNVYIIDDCTTYGASFGVASAFLKAAGAASVTGIALGKFGNQLHEFNISINSDPFQPVPHDEFSFTQPQILNGTNHPGNQEQLRSIL